MHFFEDIKPTIAVALLAFLLPEANYAIGTDLVILKATGLANEPQVSGLAVSQAKMIAFRMICTNAD